MVVGLQSGRMISPGALDGKRVLVVEDEAFFAFDLAETIEDAGGVVIGPFAALSDALNALDGCHDRIDAASLDIRLRDDLCFPLADKLATKGTPFLFVSGTTEEVPARFRARPALQKPAAGYQIVQALAQLTCSPEG